MKRFRIYYYYVAVPVLLLILGCIVFFSELRATINGNPHPEINYAIFFLIFVTIVQIVMHIRRISRESTVLDGFIRLATAGDYDAAERRLNADRKRFKQFDVLHPLRVVLKIAGGVVDANLHRALLEEIARFQKRLQRRLVLTQYMSGMMVGMGLLGTFIGLLGALADIGVLIGSFDMSSAASDPSGMIATLVSRLVAPMKSLGVAFSASMFGVFGSLLAGLLMVSVKAATNELSSILESRLSYLVELGSMHANDDQAASLAHALSELAQQSPVLQGLIVALDQSERRTREALSAVSLLAARVDANTHASSQMLQLMDRTLQSQSGLQKVFDLIQTDYPRLVQSQQRVEQLVDSFTQSSGVQHQMLQGMVRTQELAYRDALQKFVEFSQHQKAFVSEQIDAAKRQELQQQALWQQQMRQYEDLFARSLKAVQDQSVADRQILHTESQFAQEALLEHKNTMNGLLLRLEKLLKQQAEVGQDLLSSHQEDRRHLSDLSSQMAATAESMRADSLSRTEQFYQLHLKLIESLARWEQIFYARHDGAPISNTTSTNE